MKEIKFRVWDNDNNRIRHGDFGLSKGVIVELLTLPNINGTYRTEIGKQFNGILQQFTGLKDKNGKEIYEGDIMSSEMGNGIIAWVECSGKFVLKEDNFLINPWDGYEVIGNIFENKELIK